MNTTYEAIVQLALSKNTRIAYDKGWYKFELFCRKMGYDPFPASPETVVEFLVEIATIPLPRTGKPSSMGSVMIYRSAINNRHITNALPSPTSNIKVNNTIRGLSRMRGVSCRQVKALRENHILAMLNQCAESPIGLRDAAVFAIGFAGALRRSEICNLQMNDLEIIETLEPTTAPQKMFLHIRKSKTDQTASGQKIAILEGRQILPISRLMKWLNVSRITSGPVFQTMRRGGSLRGNQLHHSDIPRLIKHYAKLIGLDDKEVAGHSLRAGFVTSAAAHNARLDKIMEITRHRSPTTVMKYIRDAESFTDHAGQGFM